MDGIGGKNRHGGVAHLFFIAIPHHELLIHRFLKPTLCVRLHAGRPSRFVGRKGWGTHHMVRDSKVPYLLSKKCKNYGKRKFIFVCTISYLIRYQESAKVWQPRGVEVGRSLTTSIQPSALSSQPKRKLQPVATLCRPDSKNEKTRLKLSLIGALKNGKKGFDRSVDSSVELGFGFCFQQNTYGGWGPG